MDKKSISSESLGEITNSIIQTPTNLEFEKSVSNKKEMNKSVLDVNMPDNPDILATKNPFHFFISEDCMFLIPAIIFNALAAVTDVASTIMVNRMFTHLTEFQSGLYTDDPSQFLKDIMWPCFGMILIGLGTTLFGALETFFFTYLGERQQIRCRKHLLKSLFSRKLSWFENNKNLDGDLIQLNRSIEEFRSSISEYFSILCKSIFSIICLIVISMVYSWKLTLLMMSVFPIIVLSIVIFGSHIDRWAKEEDDQTANAISLLDWNFSSFIWIKIIFSKELELKSFSHLLDKCEYAFRQFSIFANIVSSIMKTLSLMLFVQSFWFGSYLVKSHKDSSGDIISAFYSCLKLAMTISNLSMIAVIYQKANTSFKKILKFSLSDEAIERFNKSGTIPDENLYGDIRFNNVSFDYNKEETKNPENNKILDSISLMVEPFKTTYIVGKSGSGKSTIANIILKLYDPGMGSIQIDGYDLTELDTTWLRDQITLVQQFPKVFNGTVANNILLGTPHDDIDLPVVQNAIKFFNFDTIINDLPNGLNTYIGKSKNSTDDLVQLSGGQEQKLNLVRAKLKDSPILILDESVSALDIQQRETFMEKINSWRNNKTTIIITHELAHIRDSDMVFFIEHGRIVEYGLKSELCKVTGGKFATLEVQGFVGNESEMDEKQDVTDTDIDNKSIFTQLAKAESIDNLEKMVGIKDSTEMPQESEKPIGNLRTPILISYKLLLQKLALSYKLLYSFGLLFVVIETVLTPIFTYSFSHLINGVIPKPNGTFLATNEQIKWSLIATAIAIVTGIAGFISSTSLEFSSQRLGKTLQYESLSIILKQKITFFEYANPNELSTLIMNDMRDFRKIYSANLSRLISGITVSIVCIVWTLTTGWKYSLVGFSFFPLFAIFSFIGTAIMQKTEFAYKDSLNDAESTVYESRVGVKTIMCLNGQDYFSKIFDEKLGLVLSTSFKRSISMGISINSVFFLVNVAQSIMFYYGFKLISTGEYTLIQMMQIIMMIMMSVSFISELLSSAPGLYRGLRAALKLNQLLFNRKNDNKYISAVGVVDDDDDDDDDESRIGYLTPNFQQMKTGNCITFENVTFAYPTDAAHKVLDNFNLEIPANEITSIVGESGCGKSTIVSLILRLYSLKSIKQQPNQSQRITIDGYDIDTIKLSWLMSNISVVTQKHYFFNGSIRENLLYGNPTRYSITDATIWSILRRLELTSMVEELDHGLDSPLCVSGNVLVSGGQAQRLSIARALLRPANILLLDECTASLDAHSTEIVLGLLDDLKNNSSMSIICVTHQEKIMRRSDSVVFVKDGNVAEQGRFEDLVKQKGELYGMIVRTGY